MSEAHGAPFGSRVAQWQRMLFEFIGQHRDLLVARAREKVRQRVAPASTELELSHGVPMFLDQFSSRLKLSETQAFSPLNSDATIRGGELLAAGFSIGQVVHGYGDICQSVMQLAVELKISVPPKSFKTLNMCLDVAIADAVTEYASRREQQIVDRGVEQLGFLAHELRNLLNTATLAFEAVRSGSVGVGGSTGQLVATSLVRMSEDQRPQTRITCIGIARLTTVDARNHVALRCPVELPRGGEGGFGSL